MDWMNAETLRALSPPVALILISLGAFYVLYRDRNARIREIREDRDARLADKDKQISMWVEVARASETARETQAVGLRDALEAGRSAVAAVEGLRTAVERAMREDLRDGDST